MSRKPENENCNGSILLRFKSVKKQCALKTQWVKPVNFTGIIGCAIFHSIICWIILSNSSHLPALYQIHQVQFGMFSDCKGYFSWDVQANLNKKHFSPKSHSRFWLAIKSNRRGWLVDGAKSQIFHEHLKLSLLYIKA